MTCERVTLADGLGVIVCGSRRAHRCACGKRATRLCDWKIPGTGGTCDVPLCTRCATSPAPGKDLCPAHAEAYEDWKAARPARGVRA